MFCKMGPLIPLAISVAVHGLGRAGKAGVGVFSSNNSVCHANIIIFFHVNWVI